MTFHDGSNARTRGVKCLVERPGFSSTDIRTRLTFSGVTTVGTRVKEFLGRTLSCWQTFSSYFEIGQLFGRVAREARLFSSYFENGQLFGRVAREARLKCVLKVRPMATKLSLLRRKISTANKRCFTLHRCMLNEFSDVTLPVFIGTAVTQIMATLPILSYKLSFIHSNISKLYGLIWNMVI